MLILGIESSCDETAAAIVADGRRILSSIVASQTGIHRQYGGVVPEIASREHLRQIVPVVREAIKEAGITLADVDAMNVQVGTCRGEVQREEAEPTAQFEDVPARG